MAFTPRPATRVLLLDGSPGTTTVLLLAAHHVLDRIDHVLYADTGLYPASAERYLNHIHTLCHQAGAELVRADATELAERAWAESPSPLPLFTLDRDGTAGRLPNACAGTQLLALTDHLRRWVDEQPHGRVEVVLGLGAEYAHRVPSMTTWPQRLRPDYPLFDLGWREGDCVAFNHHHGIGVRGLACLGCPERSDADWAELRATDPGAWDEAVALDTAMRHHTTDTATNGMPPAQTGYLHHACRPLGGTDLPPEQEGPVPGCLSRACRGLRPGRNSGGGHS